MRGVAFTRSFTHPSAAERVGELWVIRDGARRHGGYRTEEWVARGISATEVDRIASAQTRGRYAVCAICAAAEPDAALRADFKQLGYRLLRTEPLMTHSLDELTEAEDTLSAPGAAVGRVTTAHHAQRVARAARERLLLPEHLVDGAPLRLYAATLGQDLAGWCRSIRVGEFSWCASVYVRPEHRRRGIARGMLGRMLRDERANGARASVLLASHTGAKLYAAVGYRQIGTLLLFAPPAAAARRPVGAADCPPAADHGAK